MRSTAVKRRVMQSPCELPPAFTGAPAAADMIPATDAGTGRKTTLTLGSVQGKHSPAAYVDLCSRIHEGALGGYVQVQNGRHWRRIWWVAGSPVWFESNVPEEQLGASLVAVGLLDEARLAALEAEAAHEESLRDVLLRHEDVRPEDLHDHLRSMVARGVSAPLIWGRGDLSFEALQALPATVLRSAVLASEPPLQLLWHGTEAHVRMDQVLAWVTDPAAGRIHPTDSLPHVLPALLGGTPLEALIDGLSEPRGVDQLFMVVPDRSGGLILLLWLLELAGLVTRDAGDRRPSWTPTASPSPPAPSSLPGASVPGASMPGGARPGRPEPRGQARSTPGDRSSIPGGRAPATPEQIELALRADHQKRMNQDYYTFLGLPRSATLPELELRANKLVNRWMRAMKSRRTPVSARELAEELLSTVRLVWRTLSDEERRAEYDRRMARGQAPRAVGGIRGADVSTIVSGTHAVPRRRDEEGLAAVGQQGHRDALSYLETGHFDRAAAIMRRIRQENPSDPDVLADLGWAEWRCADTDPDKMESAEDYVRLALTFHPDHPRALEYLARIALDKRDIDGARGRLRAVLRVTPDSRWARVALDSLGEEGAGARRR